MRPRSLNGYAAVMGWLCLFLCFYACTTLPETAARTNGLSGKIKSSRMIGFLYDTTDLEFQYDTLDRLSAIHIRTVTNPDPFIAFQELHILYETGKVILKGPAALPTEIYFLKPGTNLIDSIVRDYGSLLIRYQAERNTYDEILRLKTTANYYPYNSTPYIDSIVYVSGQLRSYIFNNYELFYGLNPVQYEYQYGTLPARQNLNPYGLEHHLGMLGAYNLTFDILGLRLGGGGENAISNQGSRQYGYPNNQEQYEYRYPIFNDTLVELRLHNRSIEELNDKVIINHYYL